MIELNRIYCENCLDTMARMPDDFIDLTVTSPPYDGLREYRVYSFDFEAIAKELYRVTKSGGVVVWIIDDEIVNGNRTLNSFRQAIFFQSIGFNVYDVIIYSKLSGGLPHNRRYRDAHELMFVLSNTTPKTVNLIEDKINRYAGTTNRSQRHVREKNGELTKRGKILVSDKGVRYNIWEYNVGYGNMGDDDLTKLHPARFPEKLARDHIYSWSNEGDLVYDPFMGSGTTAKMAHILKRRWIGSEISQEYVDIANKRLEKYLMQEVLDL